MKEYFSRADQFPTLTVLINAPDTLAGQTWRVTLPLAGLTLDGRATQDAIISAVFAAQFGGASVPANVSCRLIANAHTANYGSGFDPRQTPLGSIGFELEFGSSFAGMTDIPLTFTVAGKATDAPALADITLPTITPNTTSLTLKDVEAGDVALHSELVPCCSAYITITGSETIVGLAVDTDETITVDHSGDANFALCEYPRITAPEGVVITVLAVRENADATNGAQFVLKVENTAYTVESYGEPGDIALTWTRTGVLA